MLSSRCLRPGVISRLGRGAGGPPSPALPNSQSPPPPLSITPLARPDRPVTSVGGMTTTIALITGANKGIGLETARQLGARGVTVLAGARDEARGLQAEGALREAGADARFVRLDVTDPKSAAEA